MLASRITSRYKQIFLLALGLKFPVVLWNFYYLYFIIFLFNSIWICFTQFFSLVYSFFSFLFLYLVISLFFYL